MNLGAISGSRPFCIVTHSHPYSNCDLHFSPAAIVRFLFFNVAREDRVGLVKAIVDERDIDIVILAECDTPPVQLLNAFNTGLGRTYILHTDVSLIRSLRRTNLKLFARLPPETLRAIPQDNPSLMMVHVRPPVGFDFIVVAAHLGSKLHRDDIDLYTSAIRVANAIEEAESRLRVERTVVVGDLNMNPFELGVAGGEALHAVMSRTEANEISRVIDGQKRRFFFNPMWSRFGDDSRGPPGTYYRRDGRQLCYFWNLFDQVIIRPALLPYFADGALEIVTEVAGLSLLNAMGRPDTSRGSDHLPLVFDLDIERGSKDDS